MGAVVVDLPQHLLVDVCQFLRMLSGFQVGERIPVGNLGAALGADTGAFLLQLQKHFRVRVRYAVASETQLLLVPWQRHRGAYDFIRVVVKVKVADHVWLPVHIEGIRRHVLLHARLQSGYHLCGDCHFFLHAFECVACHKPASFRSGRCARYIGIFRAW